MFFLGTEKKSNGMSILADPFKKDKWTAVHIHMYNAGKYGSSVTISGKVEFENGATKGEQEFKADTMPELLQKIEAFMTTL